MSPVGDQDAPDPVGRLIELALFAPIGAAVVARERLPEIVEVGKERVHQRLTLARFIGQMVVHQGRRELERRLAEPRPPAADGSTLRGPVDRAEPAGRPPTERATDAVPLLVPPPPADQLPIDDYESLAAGQVVARLPGLDRDALESIDTFERSHRNRRTVLNRIAQLRSTT